MAVANLLENELQGMTYGEIACSAISMLEEMNVQREKVLALAIAVRDRIEAQDEEERDPTSLILAQMIVDENGYVKEHAVIQCVSVLKKRHDKEVAP